MTTPHLTGRQEGLPVGPFPGEWWSVRLQHLQQRRLDAIEARLARQKQTTRMILILFSLLAALVLTLIVNYIPACATLAERLLGSIP
jgi:hypothetical protein